MCARYTLATPQDEILKIYALEMANQYKPNWNLAPTQNACVITADEPNLINQYHFGLVPHWAKDTKVGYSMLNARKETVLEKTSFKPLMEKNKRCLVLADGFYEWKTSGKEKLPYHFILPNRPLFAFAGLFSWWKDTATESWYKSFAILTTQPNALAATLHDRMPVILTKEEEKLWLSDGVPMNDLLTLCDPFPDEEMDLYRVSKELNNVKNNYCDLIRPVNLMKNVVLLFLCLCTFGAKAQMGCPIYGDKNVPKFRMPDSLKNRNIPATVIDQSVTLQQILMPGDDRSRFTANQYVTLTGYVVLVKSGGPETCECHSTNPKDEDIHIELALYPSDKGPQAIVVEINRYTKLDHPEFTVASLKQLVGKKVSITGWLFFDVEHLQNAVTTNPTGAHIWRYTCWEVHPVLAITAL